MNILKRGLLQSAICILLLAGCAAPDLYKTLRVANYTEQGAVRTAAILAENGDITEAQWQQVVAADELFGAAWTEAVLLLKTDPDAVAPAEVLGRLENVVTNVAVLERKAP